MYLFLINAYFICLTSTVVLLILRIPAKRTLSPDALKRLKRRAVVGTTIFIIPSIFFAALMVRQEMQESTVVRESSAADFDVERLNRELALLYPDFDRMELGYLDGWNEKEDVVEQKLTVFVYSDSGLAAEDQEQIEQLLGLEIPYDAIRFVKNF